jgi:hypothetical protein
MKAHVFSVLVLLTGLLFLAGCQTVDDRIKERPEVFARLDPATQEKIRQGIIDIGFSEDAVYIALGKPDQRRDSVSANGRITTWIYNTYYERYDGARFAGYHRSIYFDPYIRAYRVYYRPIYADTYSREVEERIRVQFQNGRVTMIEQQKD